MVELEENIGASGKPKLEGEELAALKKRLREQSNLKKQLPMFRLRSNGELAQLDADSETRAPLYISDIQHLIMYSQVGVHAPYLPNKWCQLDKYTNLTKTNLIIFKGLSVDDYFANKEFFGFLNETFTFKLELLSPEAYNSEVIAELMMVPITNTQQKKYIHRFKTIKAAETKSDEVYDIRKYTTQNSEQNTNGETKVEAKKDNAGGGNLPSSDKFPRTSLLLSGWQMISENFPLPIRGLEDKWPKYLCTKESYKPVTNHSPMFGIDCEMCLTTSGSNELTRVSVVNEKLEVIYETLVKPYNRITNYLTQYSGVTKKMMKDVKKRLQHVQKDIQQLLPPDAILVGQSLNNDMHALKLMHPYIIDTSVIYNTTGQRQRKTKLKTLAECFLQESIQASSKGHCSSEDSAAALKLVQLKLANSISFGDVLLSGAQEHLKALPDLGNVNYGTSMIKYTIRDDKKATIITDNETIEKYNFFTNKNKEKTEKLIEPQTRSQNMDIIDALCSSKNQFNIAHLNIDRTKVDKDGGKKMSKKINKWIKQVEDNSPELTLNVILFTGHSSANGCVFINIKK